MASGPWRPRVQRGAAHASPTGLEARVQSKTPPQPEDSPLAKVIKYIPAEVVAAYQAGRGFIAAAAAGAGRDLIEQGFFWLLLVLTPIWIIAATKDDGVPGDRFHAAVATLAFFVWGLALGGPVADVLLGALGVGAYKELVGALLLTVVTLLVIPLLEAAFHRK